MAFTIAAGGRLIRHSADPAGPRVSLGSLPSSRNTLARVGSLGIARRHAEAS